MDGSIWDPMNNGIAVSILPHTGIGDTNGEQLINHVADDLDRVVAGLVDDGVPDEEATTRLCCRTPHLWNVLAQVW